MKSLSNRKKGPGRKHLDNRVAGAPRRRDKLFEPDRRAARYRARYRTL